MDGARMAKKSKKRIIFYTLGLTCSGLLDLLGVAFIGVISILTVNAASKLNPKPDGRVVKILSITSLDKFSQPGQIAILAFITGIIFLAKTILSISFLRQLYKELATVANEISRQIIDRIFRKDIQDSEKMDSQSYLFSITSGVDAIAFGLIASVCSIISDAVLLSLLMLTLLYVDFIVAICSFAFFSALGLTLFKALGKSNKRIAKTRAETATVFGMKFVETMKTQREWRARAREETMSELLMNVRMRQSQNSSQSAFLPNISKYVLEGGVVVGIFLLAVSQMFSQDKVHSAGILAIFVTAGVRIVPSVLRIQQNVMNFENAREVAKEALVIRNEYFAPAPNIDKTLTQNQEVKFSNQGEILISKLTFRYKDQDVNILNEVDLCIQPGSFNAIVGPSGAGKSTLIDCILGLQSPTSGNVIIDNLTLPEVQAINENYFSYVPQLIVLIQGTLRENICWGLEPDAVSEEEIWDALDGVGLGKEFFEPKGGLDFFITEQGGNLSGGQKQRIGIARSIVSKPKVLILDEATSALDQESETEISKLLLSFKGKMTVIAIAHKFETLKIVDNLYLLSNGILKKVENIGEFLNSKNSILQDYDVK